MQSLLHPDDPTYSPLLCRDQECVLCESDRLGHMRGAIRQLKCGHFRCYAHGEGDDVGQEHMAKCLMFCKYCKEDLKEAKAFRKHSQPGACIMEMLHVFEIEVNKTRIQLQTESQNDALKGKLLLLSMEHLRMCLQAGLSSVDVLQVDMLEQICRAMVRPVQWDSPLRALIRHETNVIKSQMNQAADDHERESKNREVLEMLSESVVETLTSFSDGMQMLLPRPGTPLRTVEEEFRRQLMRRQAPGAPMKPGRGFSVEKDADSDMGIGRLPPFPIGVHGGRATEVMRAILNEGKEQDENADEIPSASSVSETDESDAEAEAFDTVDINKEITQLNNAPAGKDGKDAKVDNELTVRDDSPRFLTQPQTQKQQQKPQNKRKADSQPVTVSEIEDFNLSQELLDNGRAPAFTTSALPPFKRELTLFAQARLSNLLSTKRPRTKL